MRFATTRSRFHIPQSKPYCLSSARFFFLAFLATRKPSLPSSFASNMSTFTLKDHGVQVTLPNGLSEEQLLGFHPFTDWIKTLTSSLALQATNKSHPFHTDPYRLREVKVQSYDMFGKRLGFVKLTSKVTNDAHEWLPGTVFLRGPSVAALVILIPDDQPAGTDERYVLMTVQARVAAGSLEFVELPAGMVDGAGQFVGTAAKEVQEELGLVIQESELTDLSYLAGEDTAKIEGEKLPLGVYPSPGACDEHIRIFLHERKVKREELKGWTGKLTGLRADGEKIKLKLVRLQDVWKEGARDGKTLAAIAIYEGLKREGKL